MSQTRRRPMRLGCVVLDLRVMVGTGRPPYERLRFNSYP